MSDYKNTLNLPKTEFAMKANLATREPELVQFWKGMELYKLLQERGRKKPKFVLHDGPPYANGRIHMGTALNKTLKDIVNKSKSMSGYYTPYVPGWDCHGLPIELNVEKKIGKVGPQVSAEAFRKACRAYAQEYVDMQREDFQRLGVIGDWGNPYLTMSTQYEADIVRALGKLLENGHIYRGEKPVYWSPLGHTACAEAEVEYKEKTSHAIDVGFSVKNKEALSHIFNRELPKLSDVFVVIWTTTPWTLPANQAVAVHPELNYVLIQGKVPGAGATGGELGLILAENLADSVMARFGITDYKILGKTLGKNLETLSLRHPFLSKTVPVILGEHVTADAGTGCVHTAPAHGEDDYYLGKKYGLSTATPLNADCVFEKDTPIVGGLHVYKADEPVVNALKENGHLLHVAKIQHSYPYCWRYKTPLIYRATPQWFVSMEQKGLRADAEKSAKSVQWIPSIGEKRFLSMVEGRPDWCISRQRTWGTPIPFFIHKKTGELPSDMPALLEKIAQKIEQAGIEIWDTLDAKAILGDRASDYIKSNDVLDVWFDSGVSHFAVLARRKELGVPADLYLEGSDQHRGWFQTSLLTSVGIQKTAPFKAVLTHGYVIDQQARKMSKSLGNVLAPADLVKKFGADVLRLWAGSCDYTDDISVSDEILQRIAEAYRRIRNTARFFLANLYDFSVAENVLSWEKLAELDRWAIVETLQFQEKIKAAYERYDFAEIYQTLHHFCSVTMGSFYLDILKDRLYTAKSDGQARRSAQNALHHIVQALVRWIAPVLSFTAEEIWQHLPVRSEPSVFLAEWYRDFPAESKTTKIDWSWMMPVREAVNKVLETKRAAGVIGSALEAEVTVFANENYFEKLSRLGSELRFILITSGARVLPYLEKLEDVAESECPGIAVRVDVSKNAKCARCWQRTDDVGVSPEHPDICKRCVINVVGDGEVREFA